MGPNTPSSSEGKELSASQSSYVANLKPSSCLFVNQYKGHSLTLTATKMNHISRKEQTRTSIHLAEKKTVTTLFLKKFGQLRPTPTNTGQYNQE